MTPVLWAAFGVVVSSAILHGALALRRPIDRTYLSFAVMMALVAVLVYFEWRLYRATTSEGVVSATRRQVVVIDAFIACLLLFIPAYTNVRIPRVVMALYWAGLITLFVANLCAPYSLWYSASPELVHTTFRGEAYNVVRAQPVGLPHYAYSFYLVCVLAMAVACAIEMSRRGGRERASTFTATVGLILVHGLIVSIARNSVAGSWPYAAELALVGAGTIMSVQLAHDFRRQAHALAHAIVHVEAQAQRLVSMLGSLRALENNMTTPLHKLEASVAALGTNYKHDDDELLSIRRAVTRLRELASSMPARS